MWIVIDVVLIVVFHVAAFIHLRRRRDSMTKREVRKWTLMILFVPFIGPLGYFFGFLEKSFQRGTPGQRDSVAPFLQRPGDRR
jgi:hypothetical protein